MSVQGKCSIVKIDDNQIVVNQIDLRLSNSSNWDSYEYLFIDNVNLQNTPYDLKGVLICIKYEDTWHLGMLMKMNYNGVSFCLVKQYSLFISNEATLQKLDMNIVLGKYFGQLITLPLQSFVTYSVLYLNQVRGSRPFSQEYNYCPINSDGCYDCSVNGPDTVLPKYLLKQTLELKYYPQLPSLSLFTDKLKSMQSFKWNQKYMFQRVNIDIGTDERVNMRFVNESILSIKKKEHLNDLFACPFLLMGVKMTSQLVGLLLLL